MIPALLLRFWPYVAGAVGIVAVLFVVYQSGVSAERNRGEAARLRVELETMRLDKEIAERALVRTANDAAELAAQTKENEEQIDALQDIIKERADRGLTQRELDGLLGIK